MKFFDLFSGIGGFHLGMQQAGHECVGACEIDEHARQVYGKHFPDVTIWEDVSKIKPEDLPDFDILCAGFPCQPFSVDGKEKGFEDVRGTMFFEICRITKEKKPKILFLENVRGLLWNDEEKTFYQILKNLGELGYDVQWQICDSESFTAQSRERVFIIGYLQS